MFIFILDRFNGTHVVDFKNNQSKYRTLCGKIYFQKQNITTLAADNTFNGMCSVCKKYYDEVYLSDLNEDIRIARAGASNYKNTLMFHKIDMLGPKASYEIVWERNWSKLSRAKSAAKIKSNKYYGK